MIWAFRFRKSFILDRDTSAGKGACLASAFLGVFTANAFAMKVLPEIAKLSIAHSVLGGKPVRCLSSPNRNVLFLPK